MPKAGSFGTCKVCGTRKGKSAMVAHVKKCIASKSRPGQNVTQEPMLILRAQGKVSPLYWLIIGVKPGAQLKHLDKFLRDTWVECCGHLSAFHSPAYGEIPKSLSVDEAFATAKSLHYEYDFGSTTEVTLSYSCSAQGHLGRGVQLLARNDPPVWPCDECGQPATVVCVECFWDGKGFCCDKHAEDHACGEDMFLPVVNSPRMGICGYSG